MKKILFLLTLFAATLFATPTNAYVYAVSSQYKVTYENGETEFPTAYDYLQGNDYIDAQLYEACPNSQTAYMCLTPIKYNGTVYSHSTEKPYIRIYVHYPLTASGAVYIRERNSYQRAHGLNGTIIMERGVGDNYVETIHQADGSKIEVYDIPDLDGYDKRITIASCPAGKTTTTTQCTFTVTEIFGPMGIY